MTIFIYPLFPRFSDLMRKLTQLEGERDELASKLGKDQSFIVSNLLQKIRKLEAEIQNNHKVSTNLFFVKSKLNCKN